VASREFSEGVAFREFATLAKLKGWTAEALAREFPGINSPEPSVAYFTRVLHCRPDSGIVIPSRRMIEKYLREARILITARKLRSCKCGCGSPLFHPNQRFAHYSAGKANALEAENSPAAQLDHSGSSGGIWPVPIGALCA